MDITSEITGSAVIEGEAGPRKTVEMPILWYSDIVALTAIPEEQWDRWEEVCERHRR